MMKKLMSLGLAGILSATLLVGCSSNNNDKDETVTIKYVDENGNVVKKDHVTKEEAKQIEQKQQQTTKDNNTTKKEQTTKDEDEMTDDEMQQKGLIKKNGGHLEDEAKKQEKIHEQEDQEQQQGKYPIGYDEDGTQINDEYGNYTPEYEQKKQQEWDRHDTYNDDEDYPNKDVYDSCIDPEDTTNTDSNVEETPSEPAQ